MKNIIYILGKGGIVTLQMLWCGAGNKRLGTTVVNQDFIMQELRNKTRFLHTVESFRFRLMNNIH